MKKMKVFMLSILSAAVVFTGGLQITNAHGSNSTSDKSVITPFYDPENPYAEFWWGFPLTGRDQTITSGFGPRPGEFHKGIDLRANFVKIYAVQNGTILSSGDWGSNGGKYIALQTNDTDPDTGKKLIVRYLHLSSQSVTSGSVTKNQEIGVSGNSGGVDAHLHFDVNDAGKYSGLTSTDMINPTIFYPSPRINFTYLSSLMADESSSNHEINSLDNPEYFFDNALIEFVGRENFEKWKSSVSEKELTVSVLKKHFGITDQKEIELKKAYYK